MVRLHVLHHQIVGLPAPQDGLNVVQPLVGEVLIHRVHNGDLLVQDDVGVVGHAAGHLVLPLEQVHLMIVDAHIANIIGNKHKQAPFYSRLILVLILSQNLPFV